MRKLSSAMESIECALIFKCIVNDGEFRRAQKDFGSFITELTSLVVEKDATIPELPSKDIVSLGFPTRLLWSLMSNTDLQNLSRHKIQ